MADAEVMNSKPVRNDHLTKCAAIGVGGFALSVFFITWALLVLVRFYVFDNIFYNLFLICILTAGVIINIASLNVLLVDFIESNFLLPFIIGLPITLIWTFVSIMLPLFIEKFFSRFSFMPVALYDASFYDGLGYNPNDTTIHPFAKPFVNENSIFDSTPLILIILGVFAVAQLIMLFVSTQFFLQLRNEERKMIKLGDGAEGSSKTL